MREIAIAKYIFMGTALRYLQDAATAMRIHGNAGIIWNIDRLLKAFEEYSMPVSHRAATKLKRFRDELDKRPEDSTLSGNDVEELVERADQLRETIFAEAGGLVAFITSDKRYSVEKLLHSVRSLMRPSAFDALPSIAQEDLNECGKCIAFERSTAAAFHVLRATEAVLRHLYCCIVLRGRVSPLMWGNMVVHLRKRSKSRPADTDFLDQLDIIRKNFRNPTQHPDKSYSVDEAQNLLALCIHAIDMMTAHANYAAPKP